MCDYAYVTMTGSDIMREVRRWLCLLAVMALMLGCALAEAGDGTAPTAEELLTGGATAEELLPKAGLEVYYLDLGRVDGILIRCDGETSFIDVGYKSDADPAIKYLKLLGVDHLNSYIGSHGHADHIEGAPEMIEAFGADTIYVPHKKCMNAILSYCSGTQEAAVRAAKGVVLEAGESFSIGGAQVKCVGPQGIHDCAIKDTDENENSLILRLDYGATSFLFTGDTSDNALRAANREYPGSIDVDVLKNPHHNGAHDDGVVKLIKPKITVFCTDNDHIPVNSYQRSLKRAGSELYFTGSDHHGNVAVVSDGVHLEVRCGYPLTAVHLNDIPTMYVGQELTATGSVEPETRGSTQLGWRSSNPAVVTASKGKLKAVSEGTATITATAFNGVEASAEVEVMSAGVILENYTMQLAVGDEGRVRAKILPKGTTGITGEWVSSDESIAVVTAKGEVLAKHEGTVDIIARLSNGAEGVCKVTVTGVPVESVKLDKSRATMKVGEVMTLTATVKPDYCADTALTWRSSDESILWVDQDGNITAVGKGRAKIGVQASKKVYDVCTITVE